MEFGKYLLDQKAKNNCKTVRFSQNSGASCTKCRYLNQMISRLRKSNGARRDARLKEEKEAAEAAEREAAKKREKRRQKRLRKKQ